MDKITIYHNPKLNYPLDSPFNAEILYPEFHSKENDFKLSDENKIYSSIRETFKLSGFDIENYGTEKWNPLSSMIIPGQTILLKPNLVFHETNDLIGKNCLTTHGSFVRCIIDYVALALNGRGKIIIADSPIQGADFQKIINQTGLNLIKIQCEKIWKIEIEIIDLRNIWAKLDEKNNQIREIIKLEGDPSGYEIIDLKDESFLNEISKDNVKFAVTDYNLEVTNDNHKKGMHKYLISKSVLNADFIINISKLKTHQKAGLTCTMKNFVGIIGSKDYLAHHRKGEPKNGGDEYPDNSKKSKFFISVRDFLNKYSPNFIWAIVRKAGLRIKKSSKDNKNISKLFLSSGGWQGNDTIWRMIYDINYILNVNSLNKFGRSNILNIVDAVVCGEGNGPLSPEPKLFGTVMLSDDCLLTDALVSKLMGFNWREIKFLNNFSFFKKFTSFDGSFTDKYITNSMDIDNCLKEKENIFIPFVPATGWNNINNFNTN